MKDELDWVDIVGNHNQLGFFVLDQGSHMSKSKLNVKGLGAGMLSLCSLLNLLACFSLESCDLLFLGLWLVFVQELEQLLCLILVKGMGELGDLWRNLESSQKDSLLSLHLDVLWPLDESREVGFVHDVSPDSIASLVLGEQVRIGVFGSGGAFLLGSGADDLLSFVLLLNLYD